MPNLSFKNVMLLGTALRLLHKIEEAEPLCFAVPVRLKLVRAAKAQEQAEQLLNKTVSQVFKQVSGGAATIDEKDKVKQAEFQGLVNQLLDSGAEPSDVVFPEFTLAELELEKNKRLTTAFLCNFSPLLKEKEL